MEKAKSFIHQNKHKLLVILLVYLIVCVNIGLVNYPFIDDISRTVHGSTGFISSYARYFSEYSAWIVQGSKHLTDLGISTFILSAFILTVVSSIVLYTIFDDQKITWPAAIGSIILGVNPWFLEALSFKFDNPYISLSLLVSVIPFLLYRREKSSLAYFLLSAFGIFLMCNSYQASSGIYLLMLLTLVFRDFLSLSNIKFVLNRLLVSLGAYFFAMVLYFMEMKVNPQLNSRGDNTKIAHLSEMPKAFIHNVTSYVINIYHGSAKVWILVGFLVIILVIINSLIRSKKNVIVSFFVSVLYLLAGTIASYGVYSFFVLSLSDGRPRYAYGFSFFIGLLLIQLSAPVGKKWFNYFKYSVVSLFVYYIVSFALSYPTILSDQKVIFEIQSVTLSQDLSKYLGDNKIVYTNKLFRNSPVYDNSKRNYPILEKLIPDNSSLYWPNVMWFDNISNLHANLQPYNFNDLDKDTATKIVNNAYYDIYDKDGQLYVYMKW